MDTAAILCVNAHCQWYSRNAMIKKSFTQAQLETQSLSVNGPKQDA